VSNTLPPDTVLVDGPNGDMSYDPGNRRITWSGDLPPGAGVTSTYQLRLIGSATFVPLRNAVDYGLGEQGIHFRRRADVRIAAPDLSASDLTHSQDPPLVLARGAIQGPGTAGASTEVWVTLVVRNGGLDDAANASVDNPLPWPLRFITGTLSSGGVGMAIELPRENRVQWEGEVPVGVPVTLTYRAVAPPVLDDGMWLYNAAHLEDGLGGAWEQGGWLYVEPQRWYFPIFLKDG
jgi:uncharacterized repeat protein (TIGR01451 family)